MDLSLRKYFSFGKYHYRIPSNNILYAIVQITNGIYHELLLFVALFYAIVTAYIIILPRDELCVTINWLDSNHKCLHQRAPRPSSCITRASFLSTLDKYAAAHLAGWFVKAFVHPCRTSLWTASILFEVVEGLVSRRMPFLVECWWDRILLDVVICNSLGMEAGLLLSKLIASERYKQRSERYRFWNEAMIVTGMIVTDLNFFIIREALQLRMNSILHYMRVAFLILLALPATAQLVQHNSNQRLRPHVFAYCALLLLEASHAIWI